MSIHALQLKKKYLPISSKQEQVALTLPFPSHMDKAHHTISV